MMTLLEIRGKIQAIYQKFSLIIVPLFKLIVGYFVFTQINTQIGYDARFTKTLVVLLMSLVSAITPWAMMVFLSLVLVLAHVYFASKFLALFVLAIFIVLYCFFLRFSSKQGLAAVLIPILAPFNLHFAVPMYLGLTQNPLSAFATVCGIVVYRMFAIIKSLTDIEVKMSMEDILQFYTDAVDAFLADKEMIALIAVFVVVIAAIYFIRKLPIDYSYEIALVAGMILNIVGLLVANLKIKLSIGLGKAILMSILSAVIVLVMHLFKRILDYSAVERVQFEDDDYYYYVKAIPKVKVAEKTHKVKHISKRNETEEAPVGEGFGPSFETDDYSVDLSGDAFEDIRTTDAEEKYLKGEENFEDFEVKIDFDEDENSRF